MPNLVPNELPQLDLDYKLAIIGEAPGADEEMLGKPFVGSSGRLLSAVLSQSSILRSACLVANICQLRPPLNQIFQFDWLGEEIQQGLNQLKLDVIESNPNICLLLGATPLKAAGIKHNISDYRGTLFNCLDTSSPFFGRKCISTYHPAYVLKDYSAMPLFAFDIARAKEESYTSELTLPQRHYELGLSASEICFRLNSIAPSSVVSIDIEGGVEQGITCIGVSIDSSSGYIISLEDYPNSEQIALMRAVSRVLGSPAIPKVLQNSLYDNFVLSWLWHCPIRNVAFDTMLSGWEIYPELPKALGIQASIWTKEPFYKFERKIDDKATHQTYCIKDALVTYEINTRHTEVLTDSSKKHYEFNISLLPALLYMELRGIRYDQAAAKLRLDETQIEKFEIQSRLDQHAKRVVNPNCSQGANSLATILYKTLGYEPQYQKVKGRKTEKVTADEEALLTLFRQYGDDSFIRNILHWRTLDSLRKQLSIECDSDGRMRTTYNVVGADTGRLSSSESPTGKGGNLQAIMRKIRYLYLSDEGQTFFKGDLSGADGWTVAAHSLRLGDPTMMEDLKFGLKVAKILAMMHIHGASVSQLNRIDLQELIQKTEASMSKESWSGIYEACKVAQHGSSYQMGKNTGSSNLLRKTYKETGSPVFFAPKEIDTLQKLFFVRYWGISLWHRNIEGYFSKPGLKQISCCSGHTRTFFGRPGDQATVGSALAHEPQAVTTYATCKALHNLWYDPENRKDGLVLPEAWDTLNATLSHRSGALLIEPLHTVHDELDAQFSDDLRDFAEQKLDSYFNNPLTIANQTLTIPFGRAFRKSWDIKPS